MSSRQPRAGVAPQSKSGEGAALTATFAVTAACGSVLGVVSAGNISRDAVGIVVGIVVGVIAAIAGFVAAASLAFSFTPGNRHKKDFVGGVVGGTALMAGIVVGSLLGFKVGGFGGILAGLVASFTAVLVFGLGGFGIAALAGSLSRRRGGSRLRDRWTVPSLRRHRGTHGSRLGRRLVAVSMDRLVSFLLAGAVRRLPDAAQDRWTEEWNDHRGNQRGLRLLWWALCVRTTATRTAHELRTAQLPHSDR